MKRHDRMNEVRALIAYYDLRGWGWLLAAEFLLTRPKPAERGA